jgi:pseudouridine-5'-phosphate glycosidase/pseudouridine kinase
MISRGSRRCILQWKTSCGPHKLPSHQIRHISANNSFLKVSEEVREAINSKKPVVALETTIYTHGTFKTVSCVKRANKGFPGYPYPDNVALASEMESIVRLNGGVLDTTLYLNEWKSDRGI